MKILFFIVFCLSIFTGSAQIITVVDLSTQELMPGVLIANSNLKPKKIQVLTDQNGKVDVSVFKEEDSLYFSYSGYLKQGIRYADLEKNKYKVELYYDVTAIDEVTVAAHRWEQNSHDVPAKLKSISMREVAIQNPQTAADLLETSGYAYIQKSQQAGGSPMLRGFATNRVMIVVDGVRMNNAIFRSGNLQNVISIDANSLEGAELLFGPGAVMYGSDAIGGVMDFRTLAPQLSNGKTPLVKGSVFGRYSSANNERSYHVDYNYGTKKWSFLTATSFSGFNDLKAGSRGGDSSYLRPNYVATLYGKDTLLTNADPSLQVHSGYSQFNTVNKVRFKPNAFLDMTYSFNYSATSNAPRYDRLILDANGDGKLDNAEWYYGPQKWIMNSFTLKYSQKTKAFDNLRLILANQQYEESRHDRRFNNKRIRHQYESVNAYSANLDLDKKIGDRMRLYYGWESVHNTVGSFSERVHIETLDTTPNNSRYPDGATWQVHGIYSNLNYRLNEKWILNGGVRYSYYMVAADFDTSFLNFPVMEARNRNGALNGSLGTVFSPGKKTQIYINASTGFRAPNVDDIGKVFDSEPGNVVVPNANLKPEYAYNAEAGFVTSFSKYVHLDGAVYYTYLKDALVRRDFQLNGADSIVYEGDLSQVQAIQNVASAFVYGVQAGVMINLTKGFYLKSQISYQYGQEQSEDSLKYYPKSHVAPLFGRTTLSYQYKQFRADFYAVYNGEMSYERLPLTERNDNFIYAKDENGNPYTPAWYTLNLKMIYHFNRNISMSGGVENITDQLYRNYSSGISAPGRNFILSVKAKF
jgi:hemoglobin/transferrin/lactoferrin receptor protein